MLAFAAGQHGVCEHVDAAADFGLARVATSTDRGGFAGSESIEMATHQSVWDVHAEHGGTNSVGRIAFWKEKKGYMILGDSNATLTPS